MSKPLMCPICKKNKLFFKVSTNRQTAYVYCSGNPPCEIRHDSRLEDVLLQLYFARINHDQHLKDAEYPYLLEMALPNPILYSFKGKPIKDCTREQLIDCIDFLTTQISIERSTYYGSLDLSRRINSIKNNFIGKWKMFITRRKFL